MSSSSASLVSFARLLENPGQTLVTRHGTFQEINLFSILDLHKLLFELQRGKLNLIRSFFFLL